MKKNRKLKTLLTITIIGLCTIVIAILIMQYNNIHRNKRKWITKKIYGNPWEIYTENPPYIEWEERTITEKFLAVKYLNTMYEASGTTKISRDKIEEELEKVEATAYNDNEDYKINATLYKLKDFPKECVIAVQFEQDSNYYIYINSYYKPATMGNLVNDLKLKGNIHFGKVVYIYKYIDSKKEIERQEVEFYNVDDNAIFEMLFSNLNAENLYYTGDRITDSDTESMTIEVEIPLLGVEGKTIKLTDKGYLSTNILNSRKEFYIGQDKVKSFMNYVLDNYVGYKLVFVEKK